MRQRPAAFAVLQNMAFSSPVVAEAPEYPYEEGRGFAFEPGSDHPMLLPSAGDARPKWAIQDLIRAAEQAHDGRIAILQFHGVPDTAHDWVSSSQQNFEAYLKYLHLEKYTVIALRDLQHYVDPKVAPTDPNAIIDARKAKLKN
jgi:hypothetical protein